ncbi:MAG: DNA methyltransferase, partial [Promethearchaeota archaeon]
MRISSLKIKDLGVIYTPREITSYLCQNTIIPYILDRVKDFHGSQVNFQGNLGFLLEKLDEHELENLMKTIRNLKILDPAVGTGEFLLDAVKTLKAIYDYMSIKGICDWNNFQILEWIIKQNL